MLAQVNYSGIKRQFNFSFPAMPIEIECVTDNNSLVGEGAFWDHRNGLLWWVDIPAGLIHCLDSDGKNQTWVWGEAVGCLAVRESGGLLLATRSGFHFFDPETGHREALADPEADSPESRFNDGTTDPRGRFWAGTMSESGDKQKHGRFYRLDPDGLVTTHFDRFFMTNGLAFSAQGERLYFSDSDPRVRTLWCCDYDPDTGEAGVPWPFFDTRSVSGRPDGGTVDAEGCYWMAGVGGWQLLRLTADGQIDRIIEMPVERPTKPMFGGPGLDVLYVTSSATGITPGTESDQPQAGGLFALTGLGITGVPQTRFAG